MRSDEARQSCRRRHRSHREAPAPGGLHARWKVSNWSRGKACGAVGAGQRNPRHRNAAGAIGRPAFARSAATSRSGQDPDAIAAALEQNSQQTEEMAAEVQKRHEEYLAARQAFDAMDGAATAADAQQRTAQHAARMAELSADYAASRIASAVLATGHRDLPEAQPGAAHRTGVQATLARSPPAALPAS
jgi:hypothetical protein